MLLFSTYPIDICTIQKARKYTGSFGYQLFARFQMKIDYNNQIIAAKEPNKTDKNIGFESIPIFIHDAKPFIKTGPLTKKSKFYQLNLILDLGSNLQPLLFDQYSIQGTFTHWKSEYRVAEGLSSSIYSIKRNEKSLTFGSIQYEDIAIMLPVKSIYHREKID